METIWIGIRAEDIPEKSPGAPTTRGDMLIDRLADDQRIPFPRRGRRTARGTARHLARHLLRCIRSKESGHRDIGYGVIVNRGDDPDRLYVSIGKAARLQERVAAELATYGFDPALVDIQVDEAATREDLR